MNDEETNKEGGQEGSEEVLNPVAPEKTPEVPDEDKPEAPEGDAPVIPDGGDFTPQA